MIAFILTVLLSNAISSQPLNNVFTKDITVISEVILAGSIIFMLISIFEHNRNIDSINKSYKVLKDSYTDILSEDDIKKIFDDDKIMSKTLTTIKRWKKVYVIIWISVIFIGFILVEHL